MKITFYKYHGTGNDFIIVDNRSGAIHFSLEQIKHICHRRFGIGADGLILLNTKQGFDFEMKYYNADGAESSMCGNGGRCLVQFAFDRGIQKEAYHFLAVDGMHEAYFGNKGWIHLKMKEVMKVEKNEDNFILDTGSPHYVKIVRDVREMNMVETGRKIRYSKPFADKGINVNLVEIIGEDAIYVRTYERGVEDETLSCGTGVTASALICAHNEIGFNHVRVETPGGELAVDFNKADDSTYQNIWLCGPAVFVFMGEIEV